MIPQNLASAISLLTKSIALAMGIPIACAALVHLIRSKITVGLVRNQTYYLILLKEEFDRDNFVPYQGEEIALRRL